MPNVSSFLRRNWKSSWWIAAVTHTDCPFTILSTSARLNFYRWHDFQGEIFLLEICYTWWRHQMETFSALLAICAGNSPVPGEFPTQRPVTRSYDVYFDLRPNKRLSKQLWGWWFETQSRTLWRHRHVQHRHAQELNESINPIVPIPYTTGLQTWSSLRLQMSQHEEVTSHQQIQYWLNS